MDIEIAKRPKRIILVRHGESRGNVDETIYGHLADSKIPLTEVGRRQARKCGERIKNMIMTDNCDNWMVYFYVSPYIRTLQTLREIARAFDSERIAGIREEPRIREQDFGNFQNPDMMKAVKSDRERFGKFFYRFPEGESSADVYDRVTGFLDSLWRDITMSRLDPNSDGKSGSNLSVVIVTHGLTMRVLLHRWFKWTTRDFEKTINPGNCEVRVMEQGPGGEYSLAVKHSEAEMASWGLCKCIIEDQIWRKSVRKGHPSSRKPWNCEDFFAEIDMEGDEELNSTCEVPTESTYFDTDTGAVVHRSQNGTR